MNSRRNECVLTAVRFSDYLESDEYSQFKTLLAWLRVKVEPRR
jgi:hypothetical protein